MQHGPPRLRPLVAVTATTAQAIVRLGLALTIVATTTWTGLRVFFAVVDLLVG